ncbi:MAG: adenylyltransferase/cytidyltransferase family protein [archaeon]
MAKFETVFLAGFFDYLHKGHLGALNRLKDIDAEKIVVFVGPDERLKRLKNVTNSQPLPERIRRVEHALKKLGLGKKASVVVSETWPPKQAVNAGKRDVMLVYRVSKEQPAYIQRDMASINLARKKLGLKPLKFIVKKAPEFGVYSTLIRNGLKKGKSPRQVAGSVRRNRRNALK